MNGLLRIKTSKTSDGELAARLAHPDIKAPNSGQRADMYGFFENGRSWRFVCAARLRQYEILAAMSRSRFPVMGIYTRWLLARAEQRPLYSGSCLNPWRVEMAVIRHVWTFEIYWLFVGTAGEVIPRCPRKIP
jgi:hypothetical protein